MRISGFLLLIFFFGNGPYASAGASGYTTVFVVDQWPSETPHDASIYLACNEFGWYPDLEMLKFTPATNGTLRLVVHHVQDTLLFKITRGSWKAVEARKNGRALPNREFITSDDTSTVHLNIQSWEDLSYPGYTVYMVFLVLTSLLGILLIIAIHTIRNQRDQANYWLTLLLTLISVALLGRAATFDPALFNWQPKLILLPEIILFTYGPIFYLYVKTLLNEHTPRIRLLLYFLPALLQLLVYSPFLFMGRQTFIYYVLDEKLFPYFAVTGALGFGFSLACWLQCKKCIRSSSITPNDRHTGYIRLLNRILSLQLIYLGLWGGILAVYLTGVLMHTDLLPVSEKLTDLLWLLFSLILFVLAYLAITHPELLHHKQRYKDHSMNQDEVSALLQKLDSLLKEDQIYQQPNLTLDRLAYRIPTAPHTLSRLINEQYGKSFTELINSCRVEAFIREVLETGPDATYLEIALRVGFSSKPTFNRAFKKEKGCAPKVYFNAQPVNP